MTEIRDRKTREFFYTTHTPHVWSSGERVHTLNTSHTPIESLEEAKALALAAQNISGDEDCVEVTWGERVIYQQDIDYFGRPRTRPLLDRRGFPIPEDEVEYS